MKYFISLIILLALTSCVSPRPTMVSFTPASVVLDYTYSDLTEATSMAQQYCFSVGKDAQYVNHTEPFFNIKKQLSLTVLTTKREIRIQTTTQVVIYS